MLAPSYDAAPGTTFGVREQPGLFTQALAAGAAGYSTLRNLASPVFAAAAPSPPAKTRSCVTDGKKYNSDLLAPSGVGPYGAAPFGMPPLIAYGGGCPSEHPGGYPSGHVGGYPNSFYPGGYPNGYPVSAPMSYAVPPAYPSPPMSYVPPPAYAAPMSPLQTSYGVAPVFAAPMNPVPTSYGSLPVYGALRDPLSGSYASSPPRSPRTPQALRDTDLQPRVVPVEGRQSSLPSPRASPASYSHEPRRNLAAPYPGYGSYDYEPVIFTSSDIQRDPLTMSPHDVAGTGLAALDVRERLGVDVPFSSRSPMSRGRLLPEGPRLPGRPVASRAPLSGYVDPIPMSTSVLRPPYRSGLDVDRVVAVI